MMKMKGYTFCPIHKHYSLKYFGCLACRNNRQTEYDIKHNIISADGKTKCNFCNRLKYRCANFPLDKKGIYTRYCYPCRDKILKMELIGQIEKLIKKIDGQHYTRAKKGII